MMQGVVNPSCEATISLVISNKSRQTKLIDAVIDTGRGTLGDGSEVTFEVYAATVIWDGEYLDIPVNEAETDPLVGMNLLYGYDIQIQAVEGGRVTIKALENQVG
jgi:predicted aspartyl protease